jgi:uncharacterized protein DUF5995
MMSAPSGSVIGALPIITRGTRRWLPVAEDTRIVSLPTTVDGVIARLAETDARLPADDGVAVFNHMYLTVTEQVAAILAEPSTGSTPFSDPQTMADLDVRFANLWLAACDADAEHHPIPIAWRPLFESRHSHCLPVQFALAGMNTHIEHDLPVAVVETCRAGGVEPEALHRDYEAVNAVLAEVESGIRRSFLDSVEREVDDQVGAVVHLISTWNIDAARDVSWVTAQTLWALRSIGVLRDRYLDGVAHTVGMTSRALLTPLG